MYSEARILCLGWGNPYTQGCLKGKSNLIVMIEHNLDMIKTADYIVDLGPEGGDGGGRIITKGSPEEVVKVKGGYTGKYLKTTVLK